MGTTVRRRTNAVTEEAIAERRAEILRHTATVIVASGVAGCSFAAVSEASGFSIGMIQHYFRTRDRLVDACIDQRVAESEGEWRAISEQGGSPAERLSALLDYAVVGEKDFADAWGFWLELYAAARLDESLREKVNERLIFWHRMFHDTISEAIDSGAAKPRRPVDELAHALLALSDGLAMQAVNATYGMTERRMHELLHRFAADELGIDLGA
ncbi:TetR family transcriptional regulator C-terminal domain-containing protein [Sinomonas sp. ASV322]|uniref:TetR/AcrR family transcriptional regulator n=1 Tax=Sinomonas sp. ASV322 TaxID=3041920 RepID=UPI0027DD9F72|nr:TetR family transcriptional regulator C-terminal domain-containing protein [Sinomonas sp. ASV322]MDQ4503870.1 TetR family transcriptional regulator C-terminal domain-containing protein [Sinomonas sp. ASV322]